ncbi:MAG: zinc-finger-containing protein [Clostridia bacterium]
MKDKICPYCGSEVKLKNDSSFIYGKNYGAVYHCTNYPKCDSYVGCHKGTHNSLGRLANRELRTKKSEAHYYFDFIWKAKRSLKKRSSRNARGKAYTWLSKELGIPNKDTHIGMFDVETCERVIALCKPYVDNILNKRK